MTDSPAMNYVLIVGGFLALLVLIKILLEHRRRNDQIPLWEANKSYVQRRAELFGIPENQFALIISDTDSGSLQAFRPDPEPKLYSSYDAALSIMKADKSDDLEYYLVNHLFEILAYRSETGEITELQISKTV